MKTNIITSAKKLVQEKTSIIQADWQRRQASFVFGRLSSELLVTKKELHQPWNIGSGSGSNHSNHSFQLSAAASISTHLQESRRFNFNRTLYFELLLTSNF